jgi:hypothetical protein
VYRDLWQDFVSSVVTVMSVVALYRLNTVSSSYPACDQLWSAAVSTISSGTLLACRPT